MALPARALQTMKKPIKLRQAQVWKQGEEYFRIVRLERLEVEYKSTTGLLANKGNHHTVTKKEFCRLLKNATLLSSAEIPPAAAP
jgi:hypothetical protein